MECINVMEEFFYEFNNITDQIMIEIKNEGFEMVFKLIDDREILISRLENMNFDQKNLKELFESYEIHEKEKEIIGFLSEEKNAVKRRMEENNRAGMAKNKYGGTSKAIFFEKNV